MKASSSGFGRRGFFGLLGGVAVAGAAPVALARPEAGRDALSPVAGDKFYADGRVHPFAGDTIVCHLPQQGEDAACFSALLDIYREAPGLGFMRKVTLLPPSSYHMTIFGGANDTDRRPGAWPRDLPLDASLADCHRFIGDRLRAFPLETPLPIRMKLDPSELSPDRSTIQIRLVGADEGEDRKLRRLRDRLSDHLGIRSPGHDAYYFHVTLGYVIQPFTPGERMECDTACERWRRTVNAAAPVISLGAPEYCIFKDMFAFERQFHLT